MATTRFLLTVTTIFVQLHVLAYQQDHHTSSINYRYPRGILPCKLYNVSKLHCAERNLTAVPDLPCSITLVDLSVNRLTKVNQSQFSGHKSLKVIYLQYNELGTIPENTFSNIALLEKLILSTTRIADISVTAFTRLFQLRKLNLSYNFLKHLPNGIFDDLLDLRWLNLKSNKFSSIPDHALAPLQSLQTLDLSRSYFTSFFLGEGFRNLTNLTTLLLRSSSGVSEINNATFENAADLPLIFLYFAWDVPPETIVDNRTLAPLRHIQFMSTFYEAQECIPYMETELLHYLQIYLAPPDAKITTTTLDFISKWNITLLELNLDLSYVSGIYDSPFRLFSNLIILRVSWVSHSMQHVSDKAFYGLGNLQDLYLAGNGMNILPVDAFSAFNKTGSLQLLDLSFNSYTGYFDQNSFESVRSLKQLDLSGNPIRYIGPWIHKLTYLEVLNLSSITSILPLETNAWTMALPFLSKISFNYPELHKIIILPLDLINKAPQLQTLSLKDTYVNKMRITFGGLATLHILDLTKSFTLVRDLEKKWHKQVHLHNLTYLTLASNKLGSVIDMQFNVTTPNVEYLDLNDNYIQELNRETLTSLKNLQYLDIGNNRLVALDGVVQLFNLVHLNISHNSISVVPEEFVELVNASALHLTQLDLSGNPFDCTCAIRPFKNWILTDNKVFLKPNEMYKCNTPKGFKGLSITEINLDCKSYLIFYVSIGVSAGLTLCLITIVVIKYRWHIRYLLFILCNRRRQYQPLMEEGEEGEDHPVNANLLRYDVFVSYAHDNDIDLAWVLNNLRPNLEEGIEPFRLCIGHARDFVPGTPLLETISEAIHNSRKTLVVLSPSYLESEWCYFETQHAWLRLLNEGQDVLILILLKPIPENKMTMWLRQFLCKKGYLRWPKDRAGQELFWRCLRELIKMKTTVDRRFDV
ncbi:toll-like receptor 2 [Amphiura filiformis]|uniref:toll-like receptor 2 n=1 Tax=Amphiura filiformis TaxID=82378 RepID=UPI003B21C1B7